MEKKTCSTCELEKPIDEYGFDNRRNQTKARCKKCCSAASSAWNREHLENMRAAHRTYTQSHPGVENERARLWRINNPEKYQSELEEARNYKKNHRKQMNSTDKLWRKANPEKVKESRKRWAINHPDKYAKKAKRDWQKRRAVKCNAEGNGITPEQWKMVMGEFGYRCAYCSQQKPLAMDHIVPLSKGGRHDLDNVVPACQPCNSSKGTNSLLMFLYRRLL